MIEEMKKIYDLEFWQNKNPLQDVFFVRSFKSESLSWFVSSSFVASFFERNDTQPVFKSVSLCSLFEIYGVYTTILKSVVSNIDW